MSEEYNDFNWMMKSVLLDDAVSANSERNHHMKNLTKILEERERTHGRFTDNAHTAQHLKTTFRSKEAWHRMDEKKREALDCIAMKLARIINGDENISDHWYDIAGYATLAVQPEIIRTLDLTKEVQDALEELEARDD